MKGLTLVLCALALTACAELPQHVRDQRLAEMSSLRIAAARKPVQVKHVGLCVRRDDGLATCATPH